jgi:hypothetical protein
MPATKAAHELEVDDVIVVDGETVTVDAADDDGSSIVWLELSDGFAGTVPRGRAYPLATTVPQPA